MSQNTMQGNQHPRAPSTHRAKSAMRARPPEQQEVTKIEDEDDLDKMIRKQYEHKGNAKEEDNEDSLSELPLPSKEMRNALGQHTSPFDLVDFIPFVEGGRGRFYDVLFRAKLMLNRIRNANADLERKIKELTKYNGSLTNKVNKHEARAGKIKAFIEGIQRDIAT
ncbi:uncharacterized protein MYCGRDRAFT_91670 [Zymoseptoria tritici IPO323]|uniref:Uncharacterized protein n=1 Tax=Zymoseptoria tritici (strain CBS 115943 / IPO323) TaxID=336722 RepID=F9X7T9_ZYMTI|nr:uncharacterized protein MYCGRDRAFT_91670 [Zymoseptoria tritici IPO323]EGP88791.1 hypothetical protein MYCGRDRAFT_91670 [Zymoseptoria tritici IPO323]